jgi:acid phosphatase type 7
MKSLRLRSALFAAVSFLAIVGTDRLASRLVEAQSTPPDVILLASTARLAGAWRVLSISGAAGGTAAVLPNTGRAKVITPLANPADYFELTFNVAKDVPYRLWVRGRADGEANVNDSVHVQFTNSVDASGAARWRIGSTSSAEVNLEDCSGCGNSGWGWEDNGWGSVGALGPQIRFATDGPQTLRVQNREDGFYIDQIVLSASRYLTSSPGANKNDATYLVGAPPPSLTVVRQPYLQQASDRSVILVWATRESGAATARVNGRTFNAVSTLFSKARTKLTYDYYQHEATVTGLSPATSYPYELRVNGTVAASGSSVRTAPGNGSIRFIAFGDSGIGSTAQRNLASRMNADTFDLAIHLGDIVYGSSSTSGPASYGGYQSWFFDIYRDWLKRKPFFPSMGNHDSRSDNNNGQAYLDLFVLPDDAGASAYPDHAERYYSFDYGPVHFVALDTEFAFQDPSRRQTQLAWLRADLSSTSKLWKIAFWHRPPYSAKGEHGSDLAVRQAFGPVMEQYGVQLALTAHEHLYERTVPWRESTSSARQAVTYVISGGGGARLYPAGIAAWTAYSVSKHHYLRVNVVDDCVLRTDTIDTSGVVSDPFTLDRCAQASDAGPPTVRITSPINGRTVSGVVNVYATASDDVRVEKVDFWIDGVLRRLDRTATYSYSWDSRTVPAGAHKIQARAYDIDGNRVWSSAVTVTTTGS